MFRRAANKVKNSRDGHVSLGLLIFDEKVVYENFQKAAIAKANGKLILLLLIYCYMETFVPLCSKNLNQARLRVLLFRRFMFSLQKIHYCSTATEGQMQSLIL